MTPQELPSGPSRRGDPCTIVIFGASGDLTKRKLIPALYNLAREGLLPDDFAVVGYARRDIGTQAFREKLQEVFIRTGTTMLLVSHDLEEAVYLADQVLLLTKRPTKVAEILPYDDPRPRTVETLSEASFVATKKKSLEIFQREVRR